MKRMFGRVVIAVYWLALPLCLLVFVGSFASVSPTGTYQPIWMSAAGSAGLALLIGWRLWLNTRALGHGGPLPSLRKLVFVFLPLVLLALVCAGVALLGLVWLGLGLWLAVQPGAPDSALIYTAGIMDGRVTGGLMAGLGVLVLLAGMALNLPILRLLTRRQPEAPSPADAVTLDTEV